MTTRTASIKRKTNETDISLSIDLDGKGNYDIQTGLPFLDHMLTLFSVHSQFDLKLTCKGDIEIDGHHSTEDIGICLGQAIKEALGNKKGIRRYASGLFPMDEALIQIAIDVSNRPYLSFKVDLPKSKIGNFDSELAEEFFRAFVMNTGITLHIQQLDGTNLHHIIEGSFKALGRALNDATRIVSDSIPSSKGSL